MKSGNRILNPETRELEAVPKRLVEADPRRAWPLLAVGHQVKISGWVFQVRKITKTDLVLCPVRSA